MPPLAAGCMYCTIGTSLEFADTPTHTGDRYGTFTTAFRHSSSPRMTGVSSLGRKDVYTLRPALYTSQTVQEGQPVTVPNLRTNIAGARLP